MRWRTNRLRRFTAALTVAAVWAAYLTLWTSAAPALAPANDNFAGREVLSGSLPIEAPGSNEGATTEPNESLGSYSAAGHSVWFEWEAPATEWVTIGSCTGTLYPVVSVFEEMSGSLYGVTSPGLNEYSQQGPNCAWFEREYTLWATAGTTYAIAVDGSTNPSIQPPAAEGTFALHIESTPPPGNDDFEDATEVEGEIFGEPGPDRFYRAEASGYTWLADKQAGEPDHGGDPGGASAWYSWVAPESGMAWIGKCCSFLTSVYTGDDIGALTLVSEDGSPAFPVTGGTTYRIAVDGRTNGGASPVQMGSFFFSVSMYLPLPTPAPSLGGGGAFTSPALDTTPPRTTIFKRTLTTAKRNASFGFRSSEPSGGFQCKLDNRPFASCKSPKVYRHLDSGPHTFEVKARDAAGNRDPTPAIARFRIPASG